MWVEKQRRAKGEAGCSCEIEAERWHGSFQKSLSNPLVERFPLLLSLRLESLGEKSTRVTDGWKREGNSSCLPSWKGPEVQELQGLPACPALTRHQDRPWYPTVLKPFCCNRETLKLYSFPLLTCAEVNARGTQSSSGMCCREERG